MRIAAREWAGRLEVDQMPAAQAAYRGLAAMRYFVRGYRYAQQMSFADVPRAAGESDALSDLEQYARAHSEGPGLFKWRHYYDIYDRHLHRFRGEDVGLVEIGVAGGGSLGLWREYLGPAARICGIDVDAECQRFEDDGIEVVIGDQGDPAFWRTFLGDHDRIDIVIDDGGHLPEQQAVSLECLLPSIRTGGVYICEDIHGPFQPFHAFVDGFARPLSAIGVVTDSNPVTALQSHVASVHQYPIMTVIEKPAWVPTNFEPIRYGSEWLGAETTATAR